MSEIEKGRIAFYRQDKGYGFIASERGGENLFFHITECEEGAVPLVNDRVEFEIALGKDGRPKAVNVDIV